MTSFEIKVIAIICMFCDHFAILFLDNNIFLRCIGRLAFPIFAWMISTGYQKTKNIKKYIIRLSITAIISEFCFDFAFYSSFISLEHQNVIFTLLFGLISIYIYDKLSNKSLALGVDIIIALFATILRLDYGLYGVVMILLFYIFKDSKTNMIISQVMFNIIIYLPNLINGQYNDCVQLLCLISLVFIIKYNNNQGYKLKYLFYSFYPLHLMILAIIKRIN